jgi:hypothetical protein
MPRINCLAWWPGGDIGRSRQIISQNRQCGACASGGHARSALVGLNQVRTCLEPNRAWSGYSAWGCPWLSSLPAPIGSTVLSPLGRRTEGRRAGSATGQSVARLGARPFRARVGNDHRERARRRLGRVAPGYFAVGLFIVPLLRAGFAIWVVSDRVLSRPLIGMAGTLVRLHFHLHESRMSCQCCAPSTRFAPAMTPIRPDPPARPAAPSHARTGPAKNTSAAAGSTELFSRGTHRRLHPAPTMPSPWWTTSITVAPLTLNWTSRRCPARSTGHLR